jgi:Mg-chelatase subunit ChlD
MANTLKNLPSTDPMDNIIDDFVQVEVDPALSTKITPRHDCVGIEARQKDMDFAVTVSARSLPEDDETARAPVDIVVCLDVSGSMNGAKLNLCKETLTLLLRELGPDDRFGLVSFGSQAQIELSVKKLTPENREATLIKIESLNTSGMTNMSGGIGLAAQELNAVENPHTVRSVFLLTDGHANQGVSDMNGIISLTKNCLAPSEERGGATIHCFGYGQDHDNEMLKGIASATEGGTYYYVEKHSEVVSAFGDALGGLLSVVAQNVTVTLSVPKTAAENGVSITGVEHDGVVSLPNGSYRVTLGDFYADENRDILLRTTLTNVADENDVPHVTASVSYMDTIRKTLVTNKDVYGSVQRPLGDHVSPTNNHVALQSIRIKTTKVIAATRDHADKNELEQARNIITEYMNNLRQEIDQLEESTNPLAMQLLHELDVIKAGLLSQHMYETTTGKYMEARIQTHSMQRCAEAVAFDINDADNIDSLNVYRSKKKGMMSNKMRVASESASQVKEEQKSTTISFGNVIPHVNNI